MIQPPEIFYADMSNFELMELLYIVREAIADQAFALTSLLSAFLVTAYLVGKRLTKQQAWALSLLYSAYFLYVAFGTISMSLHLVLISSFIHIELDHLSFTIPVVALLLGSWLVSLFFMVQCRRSDDT